MGLGRESKSENIYKHDGTISRLERVRMLSKERGDSALNKVLWFTGLSGSGKSTIARRLEEELFERGYLTYVLDGDNLRHGLNSDLGFSSEDRDENIRRVAEVSKLFYDAGVLVMACFISPYEEMRDYARGLIQEHSEKNSSGKDDDFVEVYVECSVEECERRDTKGLYKKARDGEIENFTGISAPYEEPENPELVLDAEESSVEECVERLLEYLGVSE